MRGRVAEARAARDQRRGVQARGEEEQAERAGGAAGRQVQGVDAAKVVAGLDAVQEGSVHRARHEVLPPDGVPRPAVLPPPLPAQGTHFISSREKTIINDLPANAKIAWTKIKEEFLSIK